jgi:hypothetical protein
MNLSNEPHRQLDRREMRPEMPDNKVTTQESGACSSDQSAEGGNGQSNPAECLTAPPSGLEGPPEANRHRLPDERVAITHHFSIGGNEAI